MNVRFFLRLLVILIGIKLSLSISVPIPSSSYLPSDSSSSQSSSSLPSSESTSESASLSSHSSSSSSSSFAHSAAQTADLLQKKDVPERIVIGALFPLGDTELQSIFRHVIHQHNTNESLVQEQKHDQSIAPINHYDQFGQNIEPQLQPQPQIQYPSRKHKRFIVETAIEFVDHNDPSKVIRQLQCLHFNRGINALLVAKIGSAAYRSVAAFSATYNLPVVALSSSSSHHLVLSTTNKNFSGDQNKLKHSSDFTLSLRPRMAEAVASIVKWHRWSRVIYLYDSDNGVARLEDILKEVRLKHHNFELAHVARISNAGDGYKLIKELAKNGDRKDEPQYVVLSCNLNVAKAIIAYHLQDDQLDKKNYHYLLTNLVMDDYWRNEIPAAFHALNITGFALKSDHKEARKLRDAIKYLMVSEGFKADTTTINGGTDDDRISADYAMVYDATKLMLDSFGRMLDAGINISSGNNGASNGQTAINFLANITGQSQQFDCRCPAMHTFKHGEVVSTYFRNTAGSGVTANMEFDSVTGARKNFSIDVYEVVNGAAFEKVAEWLDTKGLEVTMNEHDLYRAHDDPNIWKSKNITYRVVGILQEPFLMHKKLAPDETPPLSDNDRYEGFVKELLDLIAKEAGFQYEIRLVVDRKFGAVDPMTITGWNGVIGELLRHQADIALGPIIVSEARDKIIEFTHPFLMSAVDVLLQKPGDGDGTHKQLLQFTKPLGVEIWATIGIAFFVVAIVFYLVTCLSRRRDQEQNLEPKKIGLCSSVWYTFSVVMYQFSGIYPRSISSKIVSGVWWFFVFIIVTAYFANLTANFLAGQIRWTLMTSLHIPDVPNEAFNFLDRMQYPIGSVEDLAQQSEVQYFVVRDSSFHTLLNGTKLPAYEKLWKNIHERQSFVDTYADGIQRVREGNGTVALIGDTTLFEYINNQRPCDTVKLGQLADASSTIEQPIAFAVPIGSPIKSKLNAAISKFRDDLTLRNLKNKWWKNECKYQSFVADALGRNKFGTSNLTIMYVAIGTVALIAGIVIGIIVAIIEYFCYKPGSRDDSYTPANQDEHGDSNGGDDDEKGGTLKRELAPLAKSDS